MAGAIGGLLGLGTGALLGYAGEKHRARLKQESDFADWKKKTLLDPFDPNSKNYNPLIVDDPSWQKDFKKNYGPEAEDMLPSLKAAASSYKTNFVEPIQQFIGIHQTLQNLSQVGQGAAPISPAPAGQAGTVRFTPDASGNLRPSPVAPPSASSPVTMPPVGAPSAVAPSAPIGAISPPTGAGGTPPVSSLEDELRQGEALLLNAPPRFQDAIKQRLTDLRTEIKAGQHASEKGQITPYQQAEISMQAERLSLEAKNIAQTGSLREATLALTAAQQKANNNFRDIMLGLKESEDRDRNVASFETLRSGLSAQLANIAAAQAKGVSKDTIQTQLNRLNSRLKSAKARADSLGISYNEDEFKPLKLEEIPGRLEAYTGGLLGAPISAIVPTGGDAGSEDSGPLPPSGFKVVK